MDSVQRAVGAPVTAPVAALASAKPVQAAQVEKPATPAMVMVQRAPRPEVVEKPHLDFDATEMRERLQRVVDEMNSRMRETNRNLAFGVDREVNRFVIKVTNRTNGELVRQIPGDAVLAVAHSIEDLKGVLYEDFV